MYCIEENHCEYSPQDEDIQWSWEDPQRSSPYQGGDVPDTAEHPKKKSQVYGIQVGGFKPPKKCNLVITKLDKCIERMKPE